MDISARARARARATESMMKRRGPPRPRPLSRAHARSRRRALGCLRARRRRARRAPQVGMMQAVATGGAPPPMPVGLDFEKLEAVEGDAAALLLTPAGARVSASPLRKEAADVLPDAIGAELAKVMGDQLDLVNLGATFGAFDRDGRLMYLDQVAAVEARWRGFLEAHGADLVEASLLDQDYLEQTDAFLRGVGLESIEEYLAVLRAAHERMRADAS